MSYIIPNDILKRYAFFLGDFTTLTTPAGQRIKIQNPENPTEEDYKNIMLFLQQEFTYIPKVPQFILDEVPTQQGLSFKTAYFQQLDSLKRKLNQTSNRNRLSNTFDMTCVDSFFIIYYEMERMKEYKNMILNTLNGIRSTLESVVIEPTKYNINATMGNIFNLFDVNDPDKLFKTEFTNENNHIQTFIEKYKNNYYSLFKYEGATNTPFFLKVFIENYQGKSKKFIMKMLMDYMQIVNFMQDEIETRYGILAFKYLLFFSEKPSFNRRPTNKRPTNNFDLNFEDSNIYNESKSNLNHENINSINQSKNSFNYMILSSEDNIYETYDNENLVIEDQMKMIQKLFSAICSELQSLYKKRTFNLYELMTVSLELNYLTTKFIFHYIKKNQLKDALLTKNKIFKYIQSNIQIYNTFIQDFMNWIQRTKDKLPPSISFLDKDQKLSEVYKSFFKFYFDMFQKKTSKRKDEIRDRLENAGLELDISDSEGMTPEEIEELQKIIQKIEETIQRQQQQQSSP